MDKESAQLEKMESINEILDDEALEIRWKVKGTSKAIKKKFQRLRHLEEKHPRHLKSFPVGGSARYRMSDILDYEARARSALLSLAQFTGNDLDDLDPAAGTGEKPNYP